MKAKRIPVDRLAFSLAFFVTGGLHNASDAYWTVISPCLSSADGVVFGPSTHDSADEVDGIVEGSGLAGDSFFGGGSPGISFA